MIHRGDPFFGGAMHGCSNCRHLKFVPFRCKNHFCPTCGNKYSIDRTTSMSFKIIHAKHRHCVLTIAEELRPFFLKDRSLLNRLFSAVRSVILHMFHKQNKSESFTPRGYFSSSHFWPWSQMKFPHPLPSLRRWLNIPATMSLLSSIRKPRKVCDWSNTSLSVSTQSSSLLRIAKRLWAWQMSCTR